MKEKILELRKLGKSYNEIQLTLGCSKSTISFHCGLGQKLKNTQRRRKFRAKQHPFTIKLDSFTTVYNKPNSKNLSSNNKKLIKGKLETFCRKSNGDFMKPNITLEDLINKFGENPKCYLTGQDIDIFQPRTYSFDHVIPKSRGGQNTLNNLQICTKQINMSKTDMTPDEFLNMCKTVLEYNGYQIDKLQH